MGQSQSARETDECAQPAPDVEAGWQSDIGPIRRTKLSEELADRLIANILDGKFALGERLPPERDLARYLNVGRPTLREALVTLSAIGLVEIRHGDGIYIVNRHADFVAKAFGWAALLDPGSASEVVEARLSIWSTLAEQAALRATDEDLARLEDLLDELRASLADRKRFAAADVEFHLTVARAAGNVTLQRLLQALDALHGRRSAEHLSASGASEAALHQNQALARAIAARDPAAAREAARDHVVTVAERLRVKLRSGASQRWSEALRREDKYRLTSTAGLGRGAPRRAPRRGGPAIWSRNVGAHARIGMITPSSNTMVEPITSAITAHLIDDLSIHYARIPVTKISLDRDSLGQFDLDGMLSAARLLADAQVHAICWNGISAAWKGSASDRWICDAIQRETGVPATSATIAQLEAFRAYGISRYGLAVPYLDEVREAIMRVYGEEGFECVRSAHLGISVNFDFAEVGLDTLRALIRKADSPRAEAIVVNCTNLASARLVAELEAELGKPIFDSLILALWHSLQLANWDRPIPGWGRLLGDLGQPRSDTAVRP